MTHGTASMYRHGGCRCDPCRLAANQARNERARHYRPFRFLNRAEYNSACRAEHGTARRYLAGCNCDRCSTPANRRFSYQLAQAR